MKALVGLINRLQTQIKIVVSRDNRLVLKPNPINYKPAASMAGNKVVLPVMAPASNESPNLSALPFEFKLNDSNHKIWSRMMEVHAEGLNTMGYLNGQTPAVEETEPRFSKWHTEDAIV